MAVKHARVSLLPDGADASLVQQTDWNADHIGTNPHAIDGADHTGTLGHSALTGVSADQHHAQAHAIGGADHTGALTAALHGSLGSGADHTNLLDLAGTRAMTGLLTANGGATVVGAFTNTLAGAGSALFQSDIANSDRIAILPQSATATASFTGTITSANLTAARTWTFPNAAITVAGINLAQTWTAVQNIRFGNLNDSAGTTQAAVSTTSPQVRIANNLVVAGIAAVGNVESLGSGAVFAVEHSSAVEVFGLSFNMGYTGVTPATGAAISGDYTYQPSDSGTLALLNGIAGGLTLPLGTATLTTAAYLDPTFTLASGTLTNLIFARFRSPTYLVKPTNATGLLVQNLGASGITTVVGVDIEAQSGGTTNIGLRLNANFMEGAEMTAPAAPAADGCRVYVEDNGAGKTRLMALFATGAAQQVAIQP